MVEIPCLPSQTFFCAGYPKGAAEFIRSEEKTEVMLAETWEKARDHFEGFWTLDCVLVVNQEDVKNMRKAMADAAVAGNPLPEPSFLQKLFGQKSASGEFEKIRYYVYGRDHAGAMQSVVVEATSQASALAAATIENPQMMPSGSLSERQLKGLDMMMEDARTGKSVVVNVISAENHDDAMNEVLAHWDREEAKR